MKTQINNKKIYNLALFTVLLITLITYPCVCAFAIDKAYIDDIYIWDNVKDVKSINKNDLSGFVKYIFDEDTSCFYINLFYSYGKAKGADLSDIYFGVRIKNSCSDYDFKINSNGLSYANTSDLEKDIGISYRYIDCNIKKGTGKIIIAVELKNKNDKIQDNFIDCYFTVNNLESILLIDNYEFDLTPPETTKKQTTAKSVTPATTKSTATATTKISTSLITTAKATTARLSTEKSTKFSPSSRKYTTSHKTKTTKAKEQSAAKFVASEAENITDNTSDTVSETETDFFDFSMSNEKEYTTFSESTKSSMSPQARIVLAVSIIIAAFGIFLIMTGIVGGKYMLVKTDSIPDNQDDVE